MKYKGSIKKRLIAIMMSVTILTALIGYSSFVYWYMQNQYNKALELAKTVGLVLGQDFAKLVLLNDVSAAADISSSLKSFPNLNYMVLYNFNGKAILQYSKEDISFTVEALPKKEQRKSVIKGDILKLYTNVQYQDAQLGVVEFKFEIDTIYEVIKRNLDILILILAFMFLVSYGLTLYFAKRFTEPILNLVSFLEKVELTDSLNNKIKIKQKNEYGRLYDEVNRMLERLDASHQVMKIAAAAFETQNGITITDKDEKILQVNKAFTNITGYKSEEVIGKTPKILQSGLHDKNFYADMKKSLKNKMFWTGEINNRHKDGKIVNEHLTIQTVIDDKGEVMYYVASFLDITLLKETEAKLKEKENLLIQKSKMASMGEMLENIAHQWRQPLSMISTVASSISLKRELDISFSKEEEDEQLNKIVDTVKYLSHTIDDFREFFKQNKTIKNFNLKNCYQKVLNLVLLKFKSLNIELIENIDDVEVYALENELIQVILNILNNAKDALQQLDMEEKLILIDIYKENNKAVLTIKDNAGGISEEIINRVFEAYFTTKTETNGTGIGLYMSKEMILKHMNGDISVKNLSFNYRDKPYKGACFKIYLPLEK